jgi:hypothetical protein
MGPSVESRQQKSECEMLIRRESVTLHRMTALLISRLKSILLPRLPTSTIAILQLVVSTLHALSHPPHAQQTKMTALNHAIVLAPTLIRGDDIMEDAKMCAPPGKGLPSALRLEPSAAPAVESDGGRNSEKNGDGTLVGLLEMWIKDA